MKIVKFGYLEKFKNGDPYKVYEYRKIIRVSETEIRKTLDIYLFECLEKYSPKLYFPGDGAREIVNEFIKKLFEYIPYEKAINLILSDEDYGENILRNCYLLNDNLIKSDDAREYASCMLKK